MNEFFDGIMQGLSEAIEYEKGNLPNVRVHKVEIAPLDTFNKNQIKQIRVKQNMTQKLFAAALGVSVKTVEAWEAGTNRPAGTATRLLYLLNQDTELFEKYSIIARK